jgi:hypothetical protein
VYLTTGACGEVAGLLSVTDHCEARTLPTTDGVTVPGPFTDLPANYPAADCQDGTAVNVQHDHTISDWGPGYGVFTTYITQWQCATTSPYKAVGRLVKNDQ